MKYPCIRAFGAKKYNFAQIEYTNEHPWTKKTFAREEKKISRLFFSLSLYRPVAKIMATEGLEWNFNLSRILLPNPASIPPPYKYISRKLTFSAFQRYMGLGVWHRVILSKNA